MIRNFAHRFILLLALLSVYSLHAQTSVIDSLKQVATQTKNPDQLSHVLHQIGTMNSMSSNYAEAIRYYLASAKVCEMTRDSLKLGKRYANIGIVYFYMKDPANTIRYSKKALDIFQDIHDTMGQAQVLQILSGAYFEKNIPDSALHYTREAARLSLLTGDSLSYYSSLGNTAHYLSITGEKAEAVALYKQVIPALERLAARQTNFEYITQHCMLLQNAYNSLAALLGEQRQVSGAIFYLQKVLELDTITHNKLEQMNALRELSSLYAKVGSYKKAYELELKYAALSDTLFNDETVRRINELTFKYENEKVALENARVKAENEKLKYAVALTEEQQKLSRERFRRYLIIGGFGLAVIILLAIGTVLLLNRNAIKTQYLSLLSERNKTLEADNHKLEIRRLLAQIQPHFIFNSLTSLQNHILLHNTSDSILYLDKLTQLMRSVFEHSEKELVPLPDELKVLEDYVFLESSRFEQPIDFIVTVDTSIEPEEVWIQPMLLQPLLENAIKHGLASLKSEKELHLELSAVNQEFMQCRILHATRHPVHPVTHIDVLQSKSYGGLKNTVNRLQRLWEENPGKMFFSMHSVPAEENSTHHQTIITIHLPLVYEEISHHRR